MENEIIRSEDAIESGAMNAAVKAAERASDALDIAIDLLEDIQKVISGGRPTKMKIRFGDRIITEFPLALTAAAAVAAGVAAVLMTKLAIEIEQEQ